MLESRKPYWSRKHERLVLEEEEEDVVVVEVSMDGALEALPNVHVT